VAFLVDSVVDQKLIFQTALKVNATSIIAAHNHPSSNPDPSEADLKITRKIKDSGILLDIPLLDHLIICDRMGLNLLLMKDYCKFGSWFPESENTVLSGNWEPGTLSLTGRKQSLLSN
jgi:proteasome lid subunit RPN8/RPN11